MRGCIIVSNLCAARPCANSDSITRSEKGIPRQQRSARRQGVIFCEARSKRQSIRRCIIVPNLCAARPCCLQLSKKASPGSGVAAKGRRPFVFHPQAATRVPSRSDFLCGRERTPDDAQMYHRSEFVSGNTVRPCLRLSKKASPGSGVAAKGRPPFDFHPQAATCAPPRSDFLRGREQTPDDAQMHHRSANPG
jgi:hypothetical protein